MPQRRQFFIAVALLALTLGLGTSGVACASGFNQLVAFGDDPFDTGYFRYHTIGFPLDIQIAAAVAQGSTAGSAGNGVVSTTILAQMFGLNAEPVGAGGSIYANWGATTIGNGIVPGNVSTVQQIQNYLSSVNGVANPKALYLISTGFWDAYSVFFSIENPSFLTNGTAALATEVARLQAAGARTIVVENSWSYAGFAGLGGAIPSSSAAIYALETSTFKSEWSALASVGVNFIPADTDSVFKFVVQHPSLFGFTASSVLAANAPSSAYAPPASILTPAQQKSYLFIDIFGWDLTTAGQTIEADYIYSLLVAPSEMSLIVENVLQNGLNRAASIQGQIDLSGQHRGPNGINAWVGAGAGSVSVKNGAMGFANDPGISFDGTVGADYLTPIGLILGAAFTGGRERQVFSTGGSYTQTDQAPSLYAAYKAGPFWSNLVLTYDRFQDKIERDVPLGLFTDRNDANPYGDSMSLALRGGGDLTLGLITTGPVAGVVMQQAYLDGFTENGLSGVTALSFKSQMRDSCVSQIGWRAAVDLGDWRPFAEMEWNHEWAGKDSFVTASLTSVAAPSYKMSAVPIATDWADASVGVSYKLNSQVMLRCEGSAMIINPQVTSYGGELDVNVAF